MPGIHVFTIDVHLILSLQLMTSFINGGPLEYAQRASVFWQKIGNIFQLKLKLDTTSTDRVWAHNLSIWNLKRISYLMLYTFFPVRVVHSALRTTPKEPLPSFSWRNNDFSLIRHVNTWSWLPLATGELIFFPSDLSVVVFPPGRIWNIHIYIFPFIS